MTVHRPPSNGKHICSPEPGVYLVGSTATEYREVVGEPDGPRAGETYTVVFDKEYAPGTELTCDACGKRWTAVGPVTVDYGVQRAIVRNLVHPETRRERRRRLRRQRREEDERFESRKTEVMKPGG